VARHGFSEREWLKRATTGKTVSDTQPPADSGKEEIDMLRLIGLLLIVWLVIGAAAAGQRHYYSRSTASCATDGTTAATIAAGPLNYVGANPKVHCKVPQPSS
jgi:hypothetical protein